MVRALRIIASVLFVASFPVLLITTGLRWLALSPAYYASAHGKYNAAQVIGVSEQQVRAVAAAVIDYLQSAPESLATLMAQHGADPSFFSQRDHLHMVDVHALVQVVFQAHTISLVVAILSLLIVAALYQGQRAEKIASRILWGSALTIVGLLLIGIVSFTNFDAVFLQFHFIAFTNDLWRLDPQYDRLISMFPPGFFYDMMLYGVTLALALAALLAAISGWFLFWKPKGKAKRLIIKP